jgi:hypothetical protein
MILTVDTRGSAQPLIRLRHARTVILRSRAVDSCGNCAKYAMSSASSSAFVFDRAILLKRYALFLIQSIDLFADPLQPLRS